MLLDKKTCIVTGANSGLGKALCLKLASNNARVIMLCRNEKRGEEGRKDIIKKTNNENVHLMLIDLSSLSSIKNFSRSFKSKYNKVDVLINNAGMYIPKKEYTEEKLEKIFTTNYIGPFLLTLLLIPQLKKAKKAKIINITCEEHAEGRININDLHGEKKFTDWQAYTNSKLANIFFTFELAERLRNTDITINAVAPGIMKTNFGKRALWIKLLYFFFGCFMRKPSTSAEEIVSILKDPSYDKISGRYFQNNTITCASKNAYNPSLQKDLWDVTLKLVKLDKCFKL